jgi:hypothetical protein
MEDKYRIFAHDLARRPADELVAERKEQIALEHAALQADKELRLAAQRSTATPPATRISLWEARHGLSLPCDPNHPLMGIIAESTGLDVTQVIAECERRALARAARP